MNEEQRTIIRATFNTIADGYNTGSLRFFSNSAGHLTTLLNLQGDERMLDVACGTGHASPALARQLPRGTVTGVDFTAGMLAQARSKAATQGLGNLTFLERDMQALDLPVGSFDLVVCTFGIFFVEEVVGDRLERRLSAAGESPLSCRPGPFQSGTFAGDRVAANCGGDPTRRGGAVLRRHRAPALRTAIGQPLPNRSKKSPPRFSAGFLPIFC